MTDLKHSSWGASKFESIMLCAGKIVLEAGLPNTTSKFAAEGTAAHQVLTWALQESRPAAAFIGRVIETDGFTFEVDEEMTEHVQVCIDYVLELAGADGVVLVDQRVDYSAILGLPPGSAWGTLDVAVLRDTTVTAIDLKYGMGVEVSAGDVSPNPQVALYALGILGAVQNLLGEFDTVRLAISQPRISKTPSEFDMSVDELDVWGRNTGRRAVQRALMAEATKGGKEWNETFLNPSEKSCKFCLAKATCPALRNEVVVQVSAPASAEEFESISDPATFSEPDLSRAMSKVDLIETWCSAVRAEVERRLLAAVPVPGYKLVQGKRGNRQWSDEDAAEKMLKSFRLKQEEMYSFKLITPTTAEKLAKAKTIGERQWPKLKDLITQSDGKPHVAPESDSRPALTVTPVIEDFTDVTVNDLA